MSKTDLSTYDNSSYRPGAGAIKRTLWYFTNVLFFQNPWNPVSGLKVFLLKIFGAKVGKGAVIKPSVNIKYPWRLKIGNHVWIGENVWIDNLADVTIGDNVCISQGAMLLCGNHNFKKRSFDLITGGITLEAGVWIGAKSMLTAGIKCGSHSVLSVMSAASSDLEAYTIYKGNPAVAVKKREIG